MTPLLKNHLPPVHHRVREPAVGSMLTDGHIAVHGGFPVNEVSGRPVRPLEWLAGNGLTGAIDIDGAVGGRAAVVTPPAAVCAVAECSRIDNVRLPAERALQAQEIGVAVPSADLAAERADVEDDLVSLGAPVAAHHRVAAIGQQT
jgi:hypothetical protein